MNLSIIRMHFQHLCCYTPLRKTLPHLLNEVVLDTHKITFPWNYYRPKLQALMIVDFISVVRKEVLIRRGQNFIVPFKVDHYQVPTIGSVLPYPIIPSFRSSPDTKVVPDAREVLAPSHQLWIRSTWFPSLISPQTQSSKRLPTPLSFFRRGVGSRNKELK
jgi:hypothetical protein